MSMISLVHTTIVLLLTIKLTPILPILVTINYSSQTYQQQKWHTPKLNVSLCLLLFLRTTLLLFVSLVFRSFVFKVFSVVCQSRNRSNLRFSYTFPASKAGLSRKPICLITCNGESPKISLCYLFQCGVSVKSVLLFTGTNSLAWIQLQNLSLWWLKEK